MPLQPGAVVVLVTYSFDQSKREGPAFAITGPEIEALFAPRGFGRPVLRCAGGRAAQLYIVLLLLRG